MRIVNDIDWCCRYWQSHETWLVIPEVVLTTSRWTICISPCKPLGTPTYLSGITSLSMPQISRLCNLFAFRRSGRAACNRCYRSAIVLLVDISHWLHNYPTISSGTSFSLLSSSLRNLRWSLLLLVWSLLLWIWRYECLLQNLQP